MRRPTDSQKYIRKQMDDAAMTALKSDERALSSYDDVVDRIKQAWDEIEKQPLKKSLRRRFDVQGFGLYEEARRYLNGFDRNEAATLEVIAVTETKEYLTLIVSWEEEVEEMEEGP